MYQFHKNANLINCNEDNLFSCIDDFYYELADTFSDTNCIISGNIVDKYGFKRDITPLYFHGIDSAIIYACKLTDTDYKQIKAKLEDGAFKIACDNDQCFTIRALNHNGLKVLRNRDMYFGNGSEVKNTKEYWFAKCVM